MNTARSARTLSRQERAALWKRVSDLRAATGMSRDEAEDVMRLHVRRISGQESTKLLTSRELLEVQNALDHAARQAKRSKIRSPKPAAQRETTRVGRETTEDGKGLVTREASRSLLLMAEALGWNRAQLRGWIQGRMANVCGGRPWPQSREEAIALHEGLEAILFRLPESQAPRVLARARECLKLRGLSAWEDKFLFDLVDKLDVPRGKVEAENPRGWSFRSWKSLVKLAEIERTRGGA